MDSNATENMSMDIESTNAVDASITSTVEMMQAFTLGESSDDAFKSAQAQDTCIDMDVDTPTNETVQANEMTVDLPLHTHINDEHQHASTTIPERSTVHNSACAPKPQHKHLEYLAGVDAKSKVPAAISLHRVTASSVRRGSTHPLQRHLRTPERKSQLARVYVAMEGIQEEA